MKTKPQNDLILIERLENLRTTAKRDPHAASATRAAFLIESRNMAKGVSPRPRSRLNDWMAAIGFVLAAPKKMRGAPMLNTVFTLIVVLGLAFGGGTVAAQTSQPDETLYPLKIWSEETRISFSPEPEEKFQLRLQFAARRMEEIQTMLLGGELPSEVVMLRLQTQMENAINLAAQMPDDQLHASLLQLQVRLQEQDQDMAQLELNENSDPALLQIRDRVRTMLRDQLHLCQSGLESSEVLREQLRNREQNQLQGGGQNQDGNQNQEQNQNQDQNQQQNQDSNLNQEQNQNQNQEQNQNQNQEQNQNQYQNGNDNDASPSDGNGTGPGPGDGTCPNCPCDGCDGTGSGSGDGSGNPDAGGGNGGKP